MRSTNIMCTVVMASIFLLARPDSAWPDEPASPTVLEPIVVTATRTEEPAEKVASSVTVITAEEINAAQEVTVKEALRQVPGLNVLSQGGLGRNTSVFIRGARSEDTLVMIDGMEINDPINPGRSFNFADLTTTNIERIEVVRGPQSPLYGSDSMGGVVNIITRRGEGPPEFTLLSEAGSHSTFREVLESAGKIGIWDYSFSAGRIDSDGIGSDDDYENTAFSTRMGFELLDRGKLEVFFRSLDAETHLDDWDFLANESVNDPNFVEDTDFQVYQSRYTQQLTDRWESILRVGYFESDRKDRDREDSREPGYFSDATYEGSIFDVDWQHNIYVHDADVVTVGVEYETEEGESFYNDSWSFAPSRFPEESAHNWGYYVQNQLTVGDRLHTTAGIRLDDHQEFGSETTYKLGAAYIIPATETTLKGTWGTGFKAPSLYQLYTPPIPDYGFAGGNPNLDPEKSESFDLGIEQAFLDDRLSLSAVYFHNEFEDHITFVTDPVTFISTYTNLDEAESKGWELEARLTLREDVSIYGNYTYTDTEDKENGGDLLRIPENAYSIVVDYDWLQKVHCNVGVHYLDDRLDIGGEDADSYTRVDLAVTYTVNDCLRLHGRAENLFDEEYEEVLGYDAPGISAFGGVTLTF